MEKVKTYKGTRKSKEYRHAKLIKSTVLKGKKPLLPVKPTRGARSLRAAWWDCSAARTTTIGVPAGMKTSEEEM